MNRNFIRYNRGGKLMDYENQKYHYNILQNPRKSMQINEEAIRISNQSQNNKQTKQIQKLRKTQNERLFKALQVIRVEKGRIGEMSERAKYQQRYRKSLEHTLEIKKLEKLNELRLGNTRIVSKIQESKPKIGNNDEWLKHFENSQKQKRKISRATHHIFDIDKLLSDPNKTFAHTFRTTLDTTKSKTKTKKNKTDRKRKKLKYSFDGYENGQIGNIPNEQQTHNINKPLQLLKNIQKQKEQANDTKNELKST